MFMTNIPRRKIYETMLVFEDGMIEMQILLQSSENFSKFSKAFHDDGLRKIRTSYVEIKALLVMFLQNRKYSSEEEFSIDLMRLKNSSDLSKMIRRNKNVPSDFRKTIKRMDFFLKRFRFISNRYFGKILFHEFDKFNDGIPKLLEIRRDHMNK